MTTGASRRLRADLPGSPRQADQRAARWPEIERALERAKAAAGDKNVGVMGASVAQQVIKAGLLDEILIHLVPVFLGGGVRLFDWMTAAPFAFDPLGVVEAPGVTHLRFRVLRKALEANR